MRIAERELKILQAKARHYEDLGLSITSRTSATGGSHQRGVSRVENAAIGLVDTMRSLDEQIRQYSRTIALAEKVIAQVPQEKYRQILSFRYLCGWSFRSISDEIGYKDQNSVYRAHGWALIEAQRILEKEGKQWKSFTDT